jgi:branched-chain amino acid transport system ATP-binding protein
MTATTAPLPVLMARRAEATGGRGWARVTGGRPVRPLLVMVALATTAWADRASVAVLRTPIGDALGPSDLGATALTLVTVHLAVFLSISLAFRADRGDRVRLMRVGALVFTVCSVATAVVPPWWWAFLLVRAGAAVGVATVVSTHNSLLADSYDITHRPAVYAVHGAAVGLGTVAGLVVAVSLGDRAGWRAPYLVLAVPTVAAVLAARRLSDPGRGHFERAAMGATGDALVLEEPPASPEESARLIARVESLRLLFFAMPFLAVAFVGFATVARELWARAFGFDASAGWQIEAVAELGQLAGVAVAAVVGTRLVRRDPADLARVILAEAAAAAGFVVALAVAPNAGVALVARIGLSAAVAAILPSVFAVLSLAVPARARATGFAVAMAYSLPGLIILQVASGWVADTFSIRWGVALFAPVLVFGGLLARRVHRVLDRDVTNVWSATAARAELLAARAGGRVKQLLVRDLDVSYGDLQVLFGVDVEIDEGEIVALLGTNGAGKSTLLRAVTGVVHASDGVVVFDGRDITSAPPHEVAAHGISMVPGGQGVFPSLTVAENLRVAAWGDRLARPRGAPPPATGADQALAMFPALADRLTEPAANLSGGQQQMLALAMAFLSRPRLLAIDELSLGLAPVVVEQLLDFVRAINGRGTTVVLVEQSVNLALTLADRAYFMEKGVIRFQGPTTDLLNRPDILRSVFLEGAGAQDAGPVVAEPGPAAQPRGPGRGGGDARADGDGPFPALPLAGNPSPSLELARLSVRFGGIRAVDGVSLAVAPGEILGIIGPNGAGKTTLFDIVSGFTRPDAGRVLLAGRDVTRLGPDGRARRGLGRSFQDARLFPALTVEETIMVALRRFAGSPGPVSAILRLPAHQDAEHALARWVDELVELLGIGRFRARFVHELSTGSRRIVDLACVLAHRPAVVLLDEPSSGIAQRETEALAPLIRRIRDLLGASIVLIEHDMPLVTSVADRLVALESGRVIAEGPARDVVTHPAVVASYLGDRQDIIARSGPRHG